MLYGVQQVNENTSFSVQLWQLMALWLSPQGPLAISASTYRARQKSNPMEKFYISEIVADIFTKFAEFTDEDSVHISCKFY